LRDQASKTARPILVIPRRNLSDWPLVTLGLLLDADGFPKKSGFFDGNISEPGTLKDMIDTLSSQDKRPLIVLDAGLAAEINLKWLKDQDYTYIVVSRRKKDRPTPGLKDGHSQGG